MGSLLSGDMTSENDLFDFDASDAAMGGDIDLDFEPSSGSQYMYPSPNTVNPMVMQQDTMSMSSSMSGNVGRLWPGAHSQAALAKAQAQRQQQQDMIQQQQQQQQRPAPSKSKARNGQPTDPLVEQKITQLLNSMRSGSADNTDGQSSSAHIAHSRVRKEEEDMDEDERLLASEAGKKLTSKERRQLRNKVSARAFRSRRKGKFTLQDIHFVNHD